MYTYIYQYEGNKYGITLHGTLYECTCHADRLNLLYDGELIETIPVDDILISKIATNALITEIKDKTIHEI